MCYRTAIVAFYVGEDTFITEYVATFQYCCWIDYFCVTDWTG